MKYLGFDIPDEIIDSYVDKLGCSIVDAMQAYLFDNGKIDSAEADAMTKKAQFAGVGKIVDAEYKKGERKPRTKKVNTEKRELIKMLAEACAYYNEGPFEYYIDNPERNIEITYKGKSYTINLVEHRKKGD